MAGGSSVVATLVDDVVDVVFDRLRFRGDDADADADADEVDADADNKEPARAAAEEIRVGVLVGVRHLVVLVLVVIRLATAARPDATATEALVIRAIRVKSFLLDYVPPIPSRRYKYRTCRHKLWC